MTLETKSLISDMFNNECLGRTGAWLTSPASVVRSASVRRIPPITTINPIPEGPKILSTFNSRSVDELLNCSNSQIETFSKDSSLCSNSQIGHNELLGASYSQNEASNKSKNSINSKSQIEIIESLKTSNSYIEVNSITDKTLISNSQTKINKNSENSTSLKECSKQSKVSTIQPPQRMKTRNMAKRELESHPKVLILKPELTSSISDSLTDIDHSKVSTSNFNIEVEKIEISSSKCEKSNNSKLPLKKASNSKNSSKYNESKFIRLQLINVNSIDVNGKKWKYLSESMSQDENITFIGITELTKNLVNSEIIFLLSKDKNTPVISHKDCRRVGLMVPFFLKQFVKIVDVFFLEQKRSQKDQKIAQMITYNIQYKLISIHISVIYIVPGINEINRDKLFDQIILLSLKYPKYMVMGDFNIDQSKPENKTLMDEKFNGYLTQIVDKFTRCSTKKSGESTIQTKTIIDLILVSDKLLEKKIGKFKIHQNFPSDHYLLETKFKFKIPNKFVRLKYFKDPTRRPLISDKIKPKILSKLSEKLSQFNFNTLSQKEGFRIINDNILSILDEFCPLNSNKPSYKNIWNTNMPKFVRDMKKEKFKDRNSLVIAKRKEQVTKTLKARSSFKSSRRKFKTLFRPYKRRKKKNKITTKIYKKTNIWAQNKALQEDKNVKPNDPVVINDLTGTKLADHMSNYLLERANLVSDDEITQNYKYLPLPAQSKEKISECIPITKLDIKLLLKPKKEPASLACGPDTISHRHLLDLLPSIEEPLNEVLNKPLEFLGDISLNYNRLIPKGFSNKMTEKSVRPIAELNIIPKYSLIRLFIDSLMSKIKPQMVPNQFSFAGKSITMAIIDFLDKAFHQQSIKGNKVLIVMWDFSNAFCTMSHKAIIDIAKRFGICGNMEILLKQFLDQSKSIVKMSDVNGQYKSDSFQTNRGCQQGQIGSDFIFSMVNDQILPRPVKDEFVHRTKYVDDFADIISSKSYDTLTKSLEENCDLLLKQATSTGLKLNADKTQIMALNLSETEIDNLDYNVTDNPKYLGFKLGFKGKNKRLSGNPGAVSMIQELNAAVRVISSLRKVNNSLSSRLQSATVQVWSLINNLCLVYVYADSNHWEKVCIAIRKVLKSAGLDQQAPSNDLYRVTLKLHPKQIAIKQIIILGLKIIDIEKLKRNRYNFYDPDSKTKPFMNHFAIQFQLLSLDTRKEIVKLWLSNPDPKVGINKVKKYLKNMFLKINNKKYDKKSLNKLIHKMRYRKPTPPPLEPSDITLEVDNNNSVNEIFPEIQTRKPPAPSLEPSDISLEVDNNNNVNEISPEIHTLGRRAKNMHRKTVRRK